ncbi:DUF4190 domain-containing protein [uncultured Sphaerochaeta sp.]|uniref:DUF4190 domain-containing protein n=1 Tax=uncultured Sphaerochaeta sp. TaxID=886478 RepID=UPI002A0A6B2E|nr:DUF4190 domain-containing protein [uncultured Sphaerochaeta sp.]
MDNDQPYSEQPQYGQRQDNSSLIALIMGILSLVCGLSGIASLAGTVMGIIGIVQGNKNRRYDPQAKAGFTMSIIGLVLSSLIFIAFIAFSLLSSDSSQVWRMQCSGPRFSCICSRKKGTLASFSPATVPFIVSRMILIGSLSLPLRHFSGWIPS